MDSAKATGAETGDPISRCTIYTTRSFELKSVLAPYRLADLAGLPGHADADRPDDAVPGGVDTARDGRLHQRPARDQRRAQPPLRLGRRPRRWLLPSGYTWPPFYIAGFHLIFPRILLYSYHIYWMKPILQSYCV